MRTDPRNACANTDEQWFWAFVHDLLAHPLMAFSNWAPWTLRFHDWTSHRAWPRALGFVSQTVQVPSRRHGMLAVTTVAEGFYQVQHPAIRHKLVTKANDAIEAVEHAEKWFDSLADVGIYPEGVR